MTQTVTYLLSALTILGQVVIVLFVIDWLLARLRGQRELSLLMPLWQIVKRQAYLFPLIVSFIAMAGSLYYSEVAGYSPCRLCWFQRIAMYPQVLLFIVAQHIADRAVFVYALWLSLVGVLIAAYHYYLQMFAVLAPEGCAVVGYASSCTERFVATFGYITIPMMVLTAFLLIIIGALVATDRVRVATR